MIRKLEQLEIVCDFCNKNKTYVIRYVHQNVMVQLVLENDLPSGWEVVKPKASVYYIMNDPQKVKCSSCINASVMKEVME